jgi:hypothetical protein
MLNNGIHFSFLYIFLNFETVINLQDLYKEEKNLPKLTLNFFFSPPSMGAIFFSLHDLCHAGTIIHFAQLNASNPTSTPKQDARW